MVSTRNMRSTPSKRTRSRTSCPTRTTKRRRKKDVVDESNKVPELQQKERIREESSEIEMLGETLFQEEEIEPPLPILNRISDSLLDVVESAKKKSSTNSTLFAAFLTKSSDDVDDYLHEEYGKGYYEEDESEEELDAAALKPLPSSSLTYGVSQKLIGMGLGWMYFLAFYGAYRQNEGLMGSRGLVPTKPWIDSVHDRYGCPSSLGISKWWNSNCYSGFMGLPSVFWWIDFNDSTMNTLLLIGTTLSLSCGLGKSNNTVVWLLLWILYFSVVTSASTTSFYQYGWESQLLETGVLCAFLCQQVWPKIQDLHGILPKNLVPTTQSKTPQEQPASPLVLWLFRWLCFRISIGAGMIKIRGDSCWTQKACLLYHFETQPIPSPLSFVFHFLPNWMLQQAVNLDLFVQVYTSWFVVLPATRLLSNHRWFNPYFERVEEISLALVRLGGWIQIGFMVNIALSGNLSMLNHLTILPALACLDDACYPVWVQDLVLNAHLPVELSTIVSKILERMDNNSDNTPSLSANTPSLSANHSSGEETGEESELAIETENLDPVDVYADMDAIQTPAEVHGRVSNTGIYPVGTRTKRFFDEVSAWYQGTIRSYNPDTQFYTIEYEDGDEEELEHEEIDTGSMPPHKYEIGNVFTVYLVQGNNGQNEQQNIERATMTIVSKFLFKPLRGKRQWKYSVDYSNGDSEDLSESDITQCVRLAEKHNDDDSPRSASSQGSKDQGFEEKFESQPETVEEPVEEPVVEETKKITVDGITDKSLTSLFLSSSQEKGEIDTTKPLSSSLLDTLLGRHVVSKSSSRCYQWNWNKPRVWVDILLVLTILILSIPVMENLLEIGGSHQKMNASFGSFRLVNTYGAFGSVGKERYEPIISIAYAPAHKSDPLEWIEIEFPCKPGSVDRRPCFCAPYHYRLDWNIWFIGFKPHAQMLNQRESWMYQLLEKILEKDNDVASKGWISNRRRAKPWLNLLDTTSSGLLEERGAPTYAKVDMYRYEMAAPLWRLLPRYLVSFLAGNPVQWWDRSLEEELLPVISLDSKGKLMKARIPYW